jgi:N-acetylmuramoyl-L-alanine amidase/V8-like Glu-specific endopeptidase
MRVIIDAGHGGNARAGNSSAFGSRGPSGTLEKEVTLDVARHVVARLGAGATLTRSADTNLTLGARAQLAAQRDADVFVSIHANSGPPEASGPETFVHPDAGPDSHRLADGVQRALERLRGRYGGVAEPRNGLLAVLSPRALGKRTSACLIEVDYLSNPRSEARLRDPRERAAIGAAIASAIHEHAGARGQSRPYAQAKAIIEPDIDYTTTSLEDSNRIWQDWLERYGSWMKGVPDSAIMSFPHSAICQLYLTTNVGNYWGTGFYIGDEKILSCGHNFLDNGEVTTRVRVMPGSSPTMSTFEVREFTVNGADLVHPSWAASSSSQHDLSVLRVPGFRAPNGATFSLANRSLGANEGIVVAGYGKVDVGVGGPQDRQPQRMDGARISQADTEMVYYPIQTVGGHSGSPVFHRGTVIGVHTGPRMLSTGSASNHENRGVLLNPDKIDWINSR